MNKIKTKNKYRYKYLPLILDKPADQDFDWIKKSKYFKRFVYPPKITEDVNPFSDGLKAIIPEKLKKTLVRQQQLEQQRDRRLRLILENIPEKHQWFYKEIDVSYFTEFFLISSWVKYWLNLWEKVTNPYVRPSSSSKITDFEIQQAKNYPLENLYEGKLKKIGINRYVAICPFHQEKTPSFFIFTNSNHFHCFGCNKHGDSISFLMQTKNINFIDTVRRLSGHY